MGAPQFQQLEQIVAMPGPDRCAPVADDCSSFGCCAISGYYCFETSKGKAKCMKNCTPSKTQACIQTQPIMNPILKDAAPVTTSLYCFSTYMAETGQTKKSVDELGNLQLQYKRDIGIFQCDFWQVFTEGDAELAPGVPFVKVFDTDGDFHFAKRKETGGWINTGLHAAAWKAVKEEGKYKSAEWVMKLDADAVFVPSRLRPILAKQMVPAEGVYLENCQHVSYGYFGNLEVFSLAAFETLVTNIDTCKASLPWKTAGREEEQEVRAGLRDGVHATDSPAEDPGRLREVLRRHRSRVWGLRELGSAPFLKYVPDCKYVGTPRIHPLKTTEAFEACYVAIRVRGLRAPSWVLCRVQRRIGGWMRWETPNAEPRNSQPEGRNDRWPFFVFRSSAAKPSLFEPAPWYRSTD